MSIIDNVNVDMLRMLLKAASTIVEAMSPIREDENKTIIKTKQKSPKISAITTFSKSGKRRGRPKGVKNKVSVQDNSPTETTIS